MIGVITNIENRTFAINSNIVHVDPEIQYIQDSGCTWFTHDISWTQLENVNLITPGMNTPIGSLLSIEDCKACIKNLDHYIIKPFLSDNRPINLIQDIHKKGGSLSLEVGLPESIKTHLVKETLILEPINKSNIDYIKYDLGKIVLPLGIGKVKRTSHRAGKKPAIYRVMIASVDNKILDLIQTGECWLTHYQVELLKDYCQMKITDCYWFSNSKNQELLLKDHPYFSPILKVRDSRKDHFNDPILKEYFENMPHYLIGQSNPYSILVRSQIWCKTLLRAIKYKENGLVINSYGYKNIKYEA
jgi:hypothetical protein